MWRSHVQRAIGPGTCARNGGVNFGEFIAQLTAHHSAGASPECGTENTFVPPDGTDRESLNVTGELTFQCGIHPWMHTTVLVKSH